MAKWVSMKEATEILGTSYKSVQRMVKDKKLKSKKQGNVRLVYMEAEGQTTDERSDNDLGHDRTSPRTKTPEVGQSEVGFLREMITKQQSTIDEQGDRLAELNKLFAMNQQAVVELSQTLRLQAGDVRTNDLGQNETVLRQDTDIKKPEVGQSPSQQVKNKALKRRIKPYFVLIYVLVPIIVVALAVLGLMYYKVLPSIPPLSFGGGR